MLEIKSVKESELLESITRKREEMFSTANRQGMKNKATVERSRELDILIIMYQRLMLAKTGT